MSKHRIFQSPLIALSALLIALLNLGFYVADTIFVRTTSLGTALEVVGFCPAFEKPSSETAIDPETGLPGLPGIDGLPGSSGAEGSSGLPGSDGTDGGSGLTGEAGQAGAAGASGENATCNMVDNLGALAGNLVPDKDNIYSLGTDQLRWKDLALGPGTLYIEDVVTGLQAAITVNDGTLLIDGAQSLRIGNIRITSSGILSLISSQDITIGQPGDTGYLSTARGIKFPDGSIMTVAASVGPVGPAGAQGNPGNPGSVLEIGNQDGNQSPPEILDLSKQAFVFNDGTWILPEAKDGTLVYFLMGNGGSAEDIHIIVNNLRTIEKGAAVVNSDVKWQPFNYSSGATASSLVSAVFTEGAWSVTGGRVE